MSRKIILIKQELLLLVYELNRSGLLAENEKIRPILAQLEKLLLWLRNKETRHRMFIGLLNTTRKHSVPRFFVPEHGTMFTLALVRFPPTATKEIQYLNAKGALRY